MRGARWLSAPNVPAWGNMFDRTKFKDLMHYVIWRAADSDGFGATKLYKILWFSEARCFTLTGQPIAGAEYVRKKYGPIPRLGMQVRQELVSEGRIKQWQDRHYNHLSWRFRAIVPPPPGSLTSDELQTVDFWIKHIDDDHTAASISEESHDYAWEIAEIDEPLPLFAPLVERVTEPTPRGLEWAKKKAKALGLIK